MPCRFPRMETRTATAMATPFERPTSLAQALMRHAARRPDELALRFLDGHDEAGEVLSYGQLHRGAVAIAQVLQRQAAAGERAVLLLPSGPEYVAAFFACLYAGVIALPAYPPESLRPQHLERLRAIIEDAEPKVVLTTEALLPGLREHLYGPELLAVDGLDTQGAAWAGEPPAAEAIAFLQYTSGSTATPKGVQVSHGNLAANSWLIRQGYAIDHGDVIVSWLPLYHDMGLIGGLLQGIYSGVPVVLMSPRYFLERPLRWLEAISRFGGTISGGPDFAYRLCHERIAEQALAGLDLHRWRVAFSGSELIRQDSLQAFAERFGRCGFSAEAYLASYGLAEATLFVTGSRPGQGIDALPLDAAALASHRAVSGHDLCLMACGWPQPDHPLMILDTTTGQVLGEDAVGEICSSGPSIAHGYWRNPQASAEAFFAHGGRTWLRTGDLGLLHQGQLYVSGRIKDMLILRGQNLYPQDIERTVERRVEAVRKGRVAVFGFEHEGVEAFGVAAEVSRRAHKQQGPEALIASIREQIADVHHEAPAAVLLLEPGSLPKTSSGKLQRSACAAQWRAGRLPCVAQWRQGQAPRAVAPVAEAVTEHIARLWREHLKVEVLEPGATFFAQGGHSIQAIQMVAELGEALGTPLALRTLYEAPTLEAFSAAVQAQGAPGATAAPAPRAQPGQALAQTPAQQRLWFLWQLQPASAAYTIPGGLRLRGELDHAAVGRALETLVARHEALRTGFYAQDGAGYQRIAAQAPVPLAFDDLSGQPEPEAAAKALMAREATTPFDLEQGPLLRARLLRLEAEHHLLLVTVHHIAADAWSFGILLDEFAHLYSAYSQGDAQPTLAPLARNSGDHVAWMHQQAASYDSTQDLAYWRAQLPAGRAPLALPQDRGGTWEGSPAERLSLTVSRELAAAVQALARTHDSSTFSVLLATFQALLQRYSGQADVRVGVPAAQREHLHSQAVVGFLINTQVLRAHVDPAQGFASLLAHVQGHVSHAQRHGRLDYQQVSAALGDAAGFEVMFNHLQRDTRVLRRLPGLLAEELPWHSREAKCAVQLHSEQDTQGRLKLSFDYATTLFDAATVERMAQHFIALLEQVCQQPERALGELPLLSAAEAERLRVWGSQPAPAPAWLLPAHLAEQARANASAIAVQANGQSLSYARLDRCANQLAQRLREHGVGPEVRVGLLAERSAELMVALLAILKAGGVYVPLDADYPAARVQQMLHGAGLSLLLGQAALLACCERPAELATLAIDGSAGTEGCEQGPALALHADHLAYVIFTSGTSGTPKAVGVSHGALAERLAWMRQAYQTGTADVLLQKAPLGFDVSLWECLLPLISGSRLVLAGQGEHRDPRQLVRLVREHGVTLLHFVPPLLQLFLDEPGVEHCTGLRYLFSGGEALPAELCRRVQARLPGLALHNRYGPTEAAINVSHWPCQVDEASPVPIGRPLANVLLQVQDANGQAAPPGIQGALLLGGSGLARGYLGQPALTAERFVPADGGGRWYRSGDVARWRQDGALLYLGRLDEQVKLRGVRIELEEIRHVLLGQPGVRQAAVVLGDGAGGGQLLAYVVATEEPAAALADRLREAVAATLPEPMVPAHIIALAALPLNPAGKLDRRALPAPQSQARGYRAPGDALEQRLAAIWAEVLDVPRVGLDDDFFTLGGHSLLATRIVSRARQAFAVELPLSSLFEARTLAGFVAWVRAAREAGQGDGQGPIPLIDRSLRVPLSYSQQRMWFLWQLDPASPAYNVGGMARLRGPLDVACFERALQALIQRHESLRTTFPAEAGKPWQQVAELSDVTLQRLDLADEPDAQRARRIEQLAEQQAHAPFDLECGPLLRACLAKTAEQEHYLLLTLHHIVTEGWAMDIFARELSALYAAFVEGRESPLAPLPVQYLDYSAWHRQWLEGGERQRQLDYWRAQLGGEQPLLALPSDRPRPARQSHQGELYRFALDEALAQQVQHFNRERGLTLFMTMSAALAVLLYRYSGQEDLRIGVPVAGRIRPESEGLIGAFLNTQVLRLQPHGQMRVEELLAQVRQVALDGQSHQDLPFDHLVEALQPPRSAAWNPLFQVMCNVQRWAFQQRRELAGGVAVEYVVNDARATKFDLNLEVTDFDEHLRCCLTYSTDLFDAPRIAAMAAHWQQLLRAMLASPASRLSELPLLSLAERQALQRSGQGEPVREAPASVQALFARQAAATPRARAVTCAGHTLSYAELDAQANRLAQRLRELGVGPEVRVGLALRRSTWLVVAVLATLKAGGAYVPLDPEYPAERLHYMIDDSGVRVLLGHGDLFDSLALPAGVGAWCLERDAGALAAYPAQAPAVASQPQHLAYLIYTSGSTGQPKGVSVAQGPLAMHCLATGRLFGTTPADRELHFYSINFDAASERLLVPLLFGAEVVLREQGQWDAEAICGLIRQQHINVLGFTPSYGSQLAQWLHSRGETLPVRLCITGGEALAPEHLRALRASFAPQALFNAYGPTETVVMPLACAVPEAHSAGSVPIGRVVGARQLYVVDADLAQVPAGAEGELYVGGYGVARAYHGRAGLSAERFVPDPFAAEGGRLYRTGDRVRQRADGQLEYMGRIDQQVKVRGFRIELGEIEAHLLAHEQVREAAVLAVDGPAGKQLVAYVLATAEAVGTDVPAHLRAHLQALLPEHMVPAHVMCLEHFPLTTNGKLDRRALPLPQATSASGAYQAPATPTEQGLADVWQAVLGVARVGVEDNFFALGGDSILSIQVVSRARQVGIHFTAKDLFQHQTVRTLAAAAGQVGVLRIDQGPVIGASALTPIQQWFFEQGLPAPQHWNQSLLLAAHEPLQPVWLEQALAHLVQHHDALRLRFNPTLEGPWQAHYAPAQASEVLWVREAATAQQRLALFEQAQRSLDLQHGPLLRALLVPGTPDRLLLVVHHLAVDGVSWRVLLDDLHTLYRQHEQGQAPALPAKTSAVRDWAQRLHAYAGSEPLREELRWWQAQLQGPAAALPQVNAEGRNRQCDARSASVRLDAHTTTQLLQHAPQAYRARVDDLLLTALAQTLCAWAGQPSVLVQLEGHGREALFDEIDLSRSVGWFTSAYPLRLAPAGAPGASLKAIKEQLRAVPHKGLGYGVLRYLADAPVREAMAHLPAARVTFNYLGQFGQGEGDGGWLRPLAEPGGAQHHGEGELPNWLSIDGQVYGGELTLRFTYSEQRFDPVDIERLAQAYERELRGVIAHCLESDAGGVTPSDFPLAKLDQAQLDALALPLGAIEDVFPLTPMQEGLLLHTLLEPGTGIYFMQDRYRIDSTLDVVRFDQAWRAVVARHEALRASFRWNAGEHMLQVIHRGSGEGVEFIDWSALPAHGHEPRLQQLLKEERLAGFDLLERPPLRLRLIRLGPQQYWFIMSNHHILIDAWCRSILMGDFLAIYQALEHDQLPALAAPPRYREFIAWLHHQGLEQAQAHWRQALAGFARPTFIPSDRPILHDNGGMRVGDVQRRLRPEQGARLRALAQQHQLTVNTFAQAAWALVLRRYSGERDVVFGVTVAGRPAGLPQMQQCVGLFINSIPLRVQFPAAGERLSVRQWLKQVFERNLALREHEHLPLVSIQECSELPKGQPLFDSLFVFENAPVDAAVLSGAQGLNARSESGRTHTNYPLTVVCYPGDDLGLHVSYDQRFFDVGTASVLLGEFERLLLALAEGFDGEVSALPLVDADEYRDLVDTCNASARPYPLAQGYVPLFEAKVAAHPQRIAARCEGEQWTYAQLDTRANRLGHALLGAGVRPDQPVALLAERGLALLGMINGSFKAGAGYLPLDPAHPPQRLASVLEACGAPVLVCSQACQAQAQALLDTLGCALRPRLLVWEAVQRSAVADHPPGIAVSAGHLAYVIYTSGSTGVPKGVAVHQAGMLNNQLSKVPYLELGEQDVIAQTASQSFDISVWQFLAAALCGARVEIIPDAIAHDPAALLAHVQASGVSVLESVPSLIQGLLAEAPAALAKLRWLLPTGEALPPALAHQWLQRYPQVALVNAYGPAECSDDVALFRVDEAATAGSYLPIGTPTDNNRLYVLGDELQPLARRAEGELFIAGTGVGRGYLGDPARTAASYLPDPYGEPGARVYRSGDLARRSTTGVLEYVGRADHQVKIRGYRIELGEIEARLRLWPGLREAAVASQQGAHGHYLVGYVVSEGAAVDVEAIKAHLGQTLPEYMVPRHWLALEALPLNANGKLDRKALPALAFAGNERYVAPASDLERTLAQVWAEVLGVEQVGATDNFFDLGGHSLLATRIASRVQHVLRRSVPLRAMFECSTVRELAAHIEGLGGAGLTEQTVGRIDDLMARLEAL